MSLSEATSARVNIPGPGGHPAPSGRSPGTRLQRGGALRRQDPAAAAAGTSLLHPGTGGTLQAAVHFLVMMQDSSHRSVKSRGPRGFGGEGLNHCHSWHLEVPVVYEVNSPHHYLQTGIPCPARHPPGPSTEHKIGAQKTPPEWN